MVRPIMLIDASDNRSPIYPGHSMRQCFTKDTGLAGGNINLDFLPTDVTDADENGGTALIEGEQNYIASISRLAEAALTQVIIFNISARTSGVFQATPQKCQIADNMILYPFRLGFNQDGIRFRFLGLAVTDNIRVCIWKIS